MSVFVETLSFPLRVIAWLARLFLLLVSALYLLIGAGIHSRSAIEQGLVFLVLALLMTAMLRLVDRLALWVQIRRVRRWS